MKGKEIKVIEYNLTYGNNVRLVNVLGCFKYKENDNLYIVYSDVINNYNIIYYGSSHIKDKSVLSMQCKNEKDKETSIKKVKEKISEKNNFKNDLFILQLMLTSLTTKSIEDFHKNLSEFVKKYK